MTEPCGDPETAASRRAIHDMNEQRIRSVVRTELDGQAAAEWARLAAVPCTFTWRAIDYMKRLPLDRRAALFTVLEDAALFFFDPSRDPRTHPARIKEPEYERLMAGSGASAEPWDWKYVDVRMLRALLARGRSRNPRVAAEAARIGIPPAVLARAEQIVPVKAPQVRRLVKAAVQKRFGAKSQNSGGGDWTYAGAFRGVEFVLAIDYGGRDGAGRIREDGVPLFEGRVRRHKSVWCPTRRAAQCRAL